MKAWYKIIFTVISILLVASFLRIYNLTIIPVFADEAIYIRWAQIMRNVPELRFVPLSDGKQPLFMWMVIPFFKLFEDPLFAGRMVSVLCGIGTTVGVFVLSSLLFFDSRKVGKLSVSENQKSQKIRKSDMSESPNLRSSDSPSILSFLKNVRWEIPLLASFLYAISPFAIFFDRLALADAMLSMFGIWTFIFSLLAVRYQRLDASMLAGFMLGGAFLTKSPALYFALLVPMTVLFFEWGNKKGRYKRGIITVLLWSVTLAIGYGFYNILRLGSNFQMLSSRNLDYVYPVKHILESPFDPLKPFLMEVGRWFWIMGPGVFILLVICGVTLNAKKYPRQIIFLTVLSFAPILASAEYAKVFTARYIFFSIPYLMILAATFLLVTKKKVILFGAFGIFILHSLFIDYLYLTDPQNAPLPRSERSGYLEEWTAGYGIKEVSEFLRSECACDPKIKVVVGTEGYFGTLPDGLQMYMNDMPQVTIIGVGQPIFKMPESLAESKKAGNKTYLVVNSTRFTGDANNLGLKLLRMYPKAQRPDGTFESLLLFEVDNK